MEEVENAFEVGVKKRIKDIHRYLLNAKLYVNNSRDWLHVNRITNFDLHQGIEAARVLIEGSLQTVSSFIWYDFQNLNKKKIEEIANNIRQAIIDLDSVINMLKELAKNNIQVDDYVKEVLYATKVNLDITAYDLEIILVLMGGVEKWEVKNS